ncbi:MAG: response regulator transcription factor [Bacteroidia bacterium]|nr:response regulator transcription factor [Bacteroidia bacterium]
MEKIKILLLDDEFLALKLLEEFISQISDLEIVASLKSPIKALEILNEKPVDVLFSDIQMPVLSGNSLLKTLKNPPLTVFTTAYTEFAAEAFALNAIDYLVKPFSFERFLQAIQKAKEYLKLKNADSQIVTKNTEINFITVKADGKIHKVNFEDIVFVEGLKEYAKIILTNGYLITFERMKNIEELLPISQFMRVHKSFIVAKNKVKSIEGSHLELFGKVSVPISREKKEEVVREIFGK